MSYSLLNSRLALAADPAEARRGHERVIELISRYPDLSKPQLEQAIGLFSRLQAFDIALMMSDDELAPKLERFCSDHRKRVGASVPDILVVCALVILPIALLAMLAGF